MVARMPTPCLATIDARIPAARADDGGTRESAVTSDTRDEIGDAEGVHSEGPAPLPRKRDASLCTPRHVSRQMQGCTWMHRARHTSNTPITCDDEIVHVDIAQSLGKHAQLA